MLKPRRRKQIKAEIVQQFNQVQAHLRNIQRRAANRQGIEDLENPNFQKIMKKNIIRIKKASVLRNTYVLWPVYIGKICLLLGSL